MNKEKPKITIGMMPESAALEGLYRLAFPDEDLVPLIRNLASDHDGVRFLTACEDGALVGHIAFTTCTVADTTLKAALLAPLAVQPERQGQGIGRALVEAGIAAMRRQGVSLVLVLGDPALYGRFGFRTERDVMPPYALPPEWTDAWQSLSTGSDRQPAKGPIALPDYWMEPSLWLP